ncbi:MAG: hypothetical protein GY947_11070 [Rhodobacteraceae bacterium]|nr:hypothetical protein [Paracoccaceae bacterium]
MIYGILTNAPIWVWPLLVLLIFVGLKASKQRTTSTLPIYLLPLLVFLSLNAVSKLPSPGFIWFVFLGAYCGGAATGYLAQKRWIIAKEQKTVSLRGEWITLIAVMTLFWMNFATGVVKAISFETYNSTGFFIVFAVIAGLVSGSFAGRAYRVFAAQVSV